MTPTFKSGVLAVTLLATFGIVTAQTVSGPEPTESTAVEQPAAEQPAAEQPIAEQPVAEQPPTDTTASAPRTTGATVFGPGEAVPAGMNAKITGNGNGASVVLPEAARFGQERAAAAQVERVERAQKVERVERVARVERVERPERVERVERVERPSRVERPERAERPRR